MRWKGSRPCFSLNVYLCESMKLVDVLLLSLAVVFIIIGVYEVMTMGIGHAYWSVMLAVVLFFAFTLRKKRE